MWICLNGFDQYSPPAEALTNIERFLHEWDQEDFRTFSWPGITITEKNAVVDDTRPSAGLFFKSYKNFCIF